ncbi:hypothetical protein PsYK624_043390 [Phanerochaete sordida]|uniref:Uncharacterized protein n=1 Tax=Phanerochaete sordida TaxID=48140 RepID=A0A9P3LAC7_9APHY|nr:hypothetical protein PsYK624_043390 [Phanerochaete sordida]
MLLDDDKETYNGFIYDVHKICHEVGVDCKARMAAVQSAQMAKVFSRARNLHPYLGHFKNEWATAYFVRQYLSNCRKPRRRTKKPRSAAASSSRQTASQTPAANRAASAGDGEEDGEEEDETMDLDALLDGEQEAAGPQGSDDEL